MKKNTGIKIYACIAVIVVAIFAVFCWRQYKHSLAAQEFKTLFTGPGHGRVSSFVFSGQGQSKTITDPETVSLLEESFHSPISGTMRLGVTYDIGIIFKSGAKFNTWCYLHTDKGGLTVADTTINLAGDPEYNQLRFHEPVNEKFRALMDDLIKQNPGPN